MRNQGLRLGAGAAVLAVSVGWAAGQDRSAGSGPVTLALAGGRLIDGYGGIPLENAVVLINGNEIVAVGHEGTLSVPEGVEVVDTNGMTLLPGLWESHGHLFHVGEGRPNEFQTKFEDRKTEIMARVAEISLLAGITSFRDTGGPLEAQQSLREEIESGARIGPRLFLAGPVLHQRSRTSRSGTGPNLVGTPEEAAARAKQLIEMKVDQIKVYSFWDPPVLEAITRTAHEAGIGVDADVRHIEAYRTAVQVGVDRLHHVFTADSLSDYTDEDLRLLIRGERPSALGPSGNILRGPYVLPTMQMRQAYVRALDFPEIVDHPRLKMQFPDIHDYLKETLRNPQQIPWGVGAKERMKVVKRKVRRFIEAGGREQLVAGCDAGSPLNFHSPLTLEIANLVDAGLSPLEAIQAATLRPAQMQGVDDRLGTVAVGKLADLIVVDGDPLQDITVLQDRVVHVVKDGKLYPAGPRKVTEAGRLSGDAAHHR